MLRVGVTLLVLLGLSVQVWAEEKSQYPELKVVPRASERLLHEAKRERNDQFNGYEIYLSSAATSSLFGLYSYIKPATKNSDNKAASMLTFLIGGGFAGAGYYLGTMGTPYKDAYLPISKMSKKSEHHLLIRERMAEERINNIANFNKRLRIFTGIVQVGLGAILFASSGNNDDPGTTKTEGGTNNPTLYAALANIAAGAVNFLFKHPSEEVSETQRMYKKKIFTLTPAPIKDGAGIIAGIKF